jgi:hypothetical protein
VIKDDHMPAEPESKPGSWLVYTTVAAVLFPLLYAISWGPVGSLAANHAKFGEVADATYTPMSWLESNTPLSTPLGWYWNLFSSLRPQLPSAYIGPDDDLQYFPPGPEFKLTRQVEAIEQYKLRQQGLVTADDSTGTDGQKIQRIEHRDDETSAPAGDSENLNEDEAATGNDSEALTMWLNSAIARAINRTKGVAE